MKAKYQKGGRKAERVQNRKNAKANRKKFKKFGTPLNKKSINSFRQKGGFAPSKIGDYIRKSEEKKAAQTRLEKLSKLPKQKGIGTISPNVTKKAKLQKGGFSSAGIGTSYEREKRFENREKQKPDLNPPQYYEYKDGKKTIRYKDGDTYTQPPSGTTYKINRGDNTESSEMPVDRRKGGKRYQKGGKVKSSLQYKPGFPTTGDKPSPYNLKTLKKAIARDSTTVADRGMIGDFFDPGVTSGSTGPSDQYNLQINREYRDKVTGADSKQTAKKINKMKNKKQSGGDVVERNKRPISNKGKGKGVVKNNNNYRKKTGQEVKDLGKAQLRAGRRNRRTAKGMRGEYALKAMAKDQRQAGRALKKKGRQMKRSERRTKAEAEVKRTQNWLQTGGPKEITFGAPKKMQKGGSRKTLTRTGSVSDDGKTATGTSTFTKRRKDGSVKKTITSKSTRKMRDEYPIKEGDRTHTTTKTKYNKDGSVKKSKTLKKGSRKTLEKDGYYRLGSRSAASKMKSYGPGAKEKFLQKGGARDKKFLGGLAGAIGGMKGAEGGFGQKLMGAAKGALGGGIAGRVAGAFGGLKDGGGLQGAMQGFKGGAFGNSNPMGGGQQAAGGPATQDPNAAVAQKGGLRDRRKAAKKRMKKSKVSAKKSAKKINSKNAVS